MVIEANFNALAERSEAEALAFLLRILVEMEARIMAKYLKKSLSQLLLISFSTEIRPCWSSEASQKL